MGSEFGYKYDYAFSMVDEDEIQSKYKSVKQEDGYKTFLFDIRTNFQLVPIDGGEPLLIDSERFDTSIGEGVCRLEKYLGKDRPEDICALFLYLKIGYRLIEYWMIFPELLAFSRAALDFARQMAARPQNASLTLIPVVVSFQVCTVQGEGESYEATMDRVICSKRLAPLYLWRHPTITADDEGYKPMSDYEKLFLIMLPRVRNEERLDPDWLCSLCSSRQCVGAQITRLGCTHAFHSHCILRWLEDFNACPKCGSQQYFKYGPSS